MPSKPTSKKRKATKSRRGGKINFSDFRPEDYLKTETSIRAFEVASEKDAADAAFVAIVEDIASRARKLLKAARARKQRRVAKRLA
jgi:hypothetical protein